jgi:hypothetical protein
MDDDKWVPPFMEPPIWANTTKMRIPNIHKDVEHHVEIT